MNADTARLVEILSVLEKPDPAPHELERATEFAETFQEKPDAVNHAMDVFRRVRERDALRHFVLNVLSYQVKQRWRSLPPPMQRGFQSEVLTLLQYLRPSESEASYVKEKVGAVIAEVAKRQWPQRWPDFSSALLEACSKGTVQMEVCAKVLAILAEDSGTSEFSKHLPAKRRNEIVKGLTVEARKFLPPFIEYLKSNFGGGSKPSPVALTVAKSIIPMLSSWARVMEVEAVVRLALPDMMNAFMRISSLRNNALLCLEALANRKRMGGGSEDADHDLIVLRLFELSIELLESPDSFLKLPEQITPDTLPPDFESLYTSQKIAARYLNALATMHLERIVEKAEAGRVDAERCGRVATSFLKALVGPGGLASHPSYVIRSIIVDISHKCFGSPVLSSSAMLNPAKLPLLRLAASLVCKDPNACDPPELGPSTPFYEVDFATQSEFLDYRTFVLQRVRSTLGSAGVISPTAVLEMVKAYCERVIKEVTSCSIGGEVALNGYPACRHDGALTLLKFSVMAVPETILDSEPVLNLLKQIADLYISMPTTDPLLLSKRSSSLSSFFPLFNRAPKMLEVATDKILEALESDALALPESIAVDMPRFASNADLAPSPGTQQHIKKAVSSARDKVAAALVSLARHLPTLMLPLLPRLADRISRIVFRPYVRDNERVSLYDTLVTISNHSDNLQQQSDFIRTILRQPMMLWTSKELQEATSDAKRFLHFLALAPSVAGPPPEFPSVFTKTDGASSVSRISALLRASVVIWSVGRATQPPIVTEITQRRRALSKQRKKGTEAKEEMEQFPTIPGSGVGEGNGILLHPVPHPAFSRYWPELLPPILRMLSCLHELWKPELIKDIGNAEPAKWTYAVCEDEVRLYCGDDVVEEVSEETASRIRMISLQTHRLRHHLYGMLGLAAAHAKEGLLGGPGMLALKQTVEGPLAPAYLSCMRLRHLKMVAVQMIPPLLRRCPPSEIGHVASAAVAPLLDCIRKRVSEPQSDELLLPGVERSAQELLKDKFRRDSYRAVADALCIISGVKTSAGRSASTGDQNSLILAIELMNQSPDVLSLLLNTAVLVLRGGEPPGGIPRGSPFRRLFDTTACCRVASGIMALTPLVSGDPTYHDTMLEIFRVLVDSLVSGRKWTAGVEGVIIELLVEAYACYVLRKYDPSLDLPPPRSTMPILRPREMLLTLPGIDAEELKSMEVDLMTARSGGAPGTAGASAAMKGARKKLKDVLAAAASNMPESTEAGASSLFRHQTPSVADLPEELVMPKKLKEQGGMVDGKATAKMFGESDGNGWNSGGWGRDGGDGWDANDF